MEINDLIKALREKKSRDKRELLDEAADVIELLYRMRDKEALSEELRVKSEEFRSIFADVRKSSTNCLREVAPYEGEWIPTSERVPSKTDEYIVVIEGFPVATALYYDAAMRVWMDRLDEEPSYYRVSYWMEMPKVPGKMQSSECRVQSEEVIKGLECCRTENGNDCDECPYWGRQYAPGSGGCSNQLVNDALELINYLRKRGE